MKQNKAVQFIKEYAYITFATFITAASVFFFLMPSHLSVGSISGLAIVLSNAIPLSVSTITMVLNILLLIVGFILIGREFSAKTVYTSILLPLFIGLFEWLLPDFTSITQDAFLDMICYIFSVSVGLAMLFGANASSGGLDIVAKILNKYLHMDLGKAMSAAGICVAISALLVYDLKTAVLSVLGTYLNGVVLDHFIFGFNEKKRVCIISEKQEEIKAFILHELHSGATIYEAWGAYGENKHEEIITIVDKNEYAKLMTFIKKTDAGAFVTVYAVNNIIYQPKK